jgi:hypothetical protein
MFDVNQTVDRLSPVRLEGKKRTKASLIPRLIFLTRTFVDGPGDELCHFHKDTSDRDGYDPLKPGNLTNFFSCQFVDRRS